MLSLRKAGEQAKSSSIGTENLGSMRFASATLARDFGDTCMDANDDLSLTRPEFAEDPAGGLRDDNEGLPGGSGTTCLE